MQVKKADMMKEGIMYAAETAYTVWVILSISLCAGMFVECPVQERLLKIRYYLNVLGLKQTVYWLGNLAFDLVIYAIQGGSLVILLYALPLEAFRSAFS